MVWVYLEDEYWEWWWWENYGKEVIEGGSKY